MDVTDLMGDVTDAPGPGELWVPPGPEPDSTWAAAPDALPVVVSAWELSVQGGALAARPQRLSTPRSVVALKEDDWWCRERVRRFVQAWRWLNQVKERSPAAMSRADCDRYLAGAGVLVRIRPPRH